MPQESADSFDFVPHSPIRKAIAARVAQSRREIPTFCLTARADASALVAVREALKAESGGAGLRTGPSADNLPSYNDLLICLTARVLRGHPRLNSHYTDEGLRIFHGVNMGLAVATEVGVLLPVIQSADAKGLGEVAREARERVELARAGKLRASLQAGATFTISNIGPGPVEFFDAVINSPQVAILAIGSLAPRPVAVDLSTEASAKVEGRVEVRPTLSLTLTVDHRAIDGADGAAFLADLVTAIETVTREKLKEYGI